MRLTPIGLRVIVNEKPLNLEKTTSSVLSVLLLLYVTNNQRLIRKLVIFKVFFQFNMHKYLRVIVNEKLLNLEKTTSSVQSVRLIIYESFVVFYQFLEFFILI